MSVNALLNQIGMGGAEEPLFAEDVFSTFLYTGTDAAQTIANGVNLAGEGGLVWIKARTQAYSHNLIDSARGTGKTLISNTAAAQVVNSDVGLTAFNSNGFTTAINGGVAESGSPFCSWTFRKAPKFFDVVTYTGNSTFGRTVAHSLGSAPGMIIVKAITDPGYTADWYVWHRSLSANHNIKLNTTAVSSSDIQVIVGGDATNITLTQFGGANESGQTYVAYIFAHNAGGFGEEEEDNIISCGTYTGNGSTTGPIINLGYEPQFVMAKAASTTGDWFMVDTMRGQGVEGSTSNQLKANTADAEGLSNFIAINATGFQLTASVTDKNGSGQTFIYMAIRRPMKPPTSGTEVFSRITWSGSDAQTLTPGIAFDLVVQNTSIDTSPSGFYFGSRLQGDTKYLTSTSSSAEGTFNSWQFGLATGTFKQSLTTGTLGNSINYFFRRASGFFDIICYTGTGGARTVAHNLGAVPELMIVKQRVGAENNWTTYSASVGNTRASAINTTLSFYFFDESNNWWNSTTPTSTVFSVTSTGALNTTSGTYVAYLFASVAGVSKVGSYTGTGVTNQTFVVTNSSSAAYLIDSVSNPTLNLKRGATYTFSVNASGHPFFIKTAAVTGTGSQYNTGVTNNGAQVGDVVFTIPLDAPDTLFYICQIHGGMGGTINITGSGPTQIINCGFTTGARFVMIKRADSAGDWYVWDTARGIIAGNDPYLFLNSNAAEVTNTDFIDPAASGFEISSTAPAAINASGGSFIFLAIA